MADLSDFTIKRASINSTGEMIEVLAPDGLVVGDAVRADDESRSLWTYRVTEGDWEYGVSDSQLDALIAVFDEIRRREFGIDYTRKPWPRFADKEALLDAVKAADEKGRASAEAIRHAREWPNIYETGMELTQSPTEVHGKESFRFAVESPARRVMAIRVYRERDSFFVDGVDVDRQAFLDAMRDFK